MLGRSDVATTLVATDPWSEWLRFRDDFAAMLDPETHTIEWLDGEVATGRMLLFATDASAIIASVRTYPTGLRELEGQAATGNLADIVGDLIPRAEAYARQIGCRYASIASREGWSRMLQGSGYKIHQTMIRKAL